MQDRRGSTAIEYALIASLLAIVIVAAITQLGTAITTLYASIRI